MAVRVLFALCSAAAALAVVAVAESDADPESSYQRYQRYQPYPTYDVRQDHRPYYSSHHIPKPAHSFPPTASLPWLPPAAVPVNGMGSSSSPTPSWSLPPPQGRPLDRGAEAKHFRAVPAVPREHLEVYGPRDIAKTVFPAVGLVGAEPTAPAHFPLVPQGTFGSFSQAIDAVPLPIEPIPGNVISNQYHAQDEFGNVAYGYANPNSAKAERRDALGNVVGAYSYVDANGYPKKVSYIADDHGFRVTASNILPESVV